MLEVNVINVWGGGRVDVMVGEERVDDVVLGNEGFNDREGGEGLLEVGDGMGGVWVGMEGVGFEFVG